MLHITITPTPYGQLVDNTMQGAPHKCTCLVSIQSDKKHKPIAIKYQNDSYADYCDIFLRLSILSISVSIKCMCRST